MLMSLAAGALAALSLVQQTDTVISVRPGTRLDVENFGGEIVVRAWDRNAVRVVASHGERNAIEFENAESVLSVEAVSHRGAPAMVDYQITVPASMDLNLSGVYTDVLVEGVKGQVMVETVEGDVRVRGGGGLVSLSSVQGPVVLEGANARVEVHSVNEAVRVANTTGDVYAETINGDVTLQSVQTGNLEASTVNGDVRYDGAIRDGGRYRFATHNGDIFLAVPPGANATVSVATFGGEFQSSFPVSVKESRPGKRFNLTLGSGSSRIDLESFQGTIQLVRPGEIPPPEPVEPEHEEERDHQEEE